MIAGDAGRKLRRLRSLWRTRKNRRDEINVWGRRSQRIVRSLNNFIMIYFQVVRPSLIVMYTGGRQ